MLIGLRLEVGFAQDHAYRRLYGEREILPFLRELGFDAVETPVGPETDPDALTEHVARCVNAGLKVSLHPYSEGSLFNPLLFSRDADNACRKLHERFFSLASDAAERQEFPTVVNIHGAAGTSSDTRRHLVDQTIAFFTWAGEWCRQNAPEVGVTVELQISPNPDEAGRRIGDRYEELLNVATRSNVGACWDFGHAYWNAYRYGWPLLPPEALLPHICHVHCHDVHGGEDHQPLVYGEVAWREFIRLLADHGFDGRIILEVPPDQFLRAGGLPSLVDSITALKDCRRDILRDRSER